MHVYVYIRVRVILLHESEHDMGKCFKYYYYWCFIGTVSLCSIGLVMNDVEERHWTEVNISSH